MEITWLGHGTFQFRLPSGQVVLMDPWTEGNPAYPEGYQIEHVDTICITHGHFDHIHDAVPLAKRFSPEVVGIFETCAWLESKGVKNTRPMNKGGSQKAGDVTLTMTHAVHSCGILDEGKIIYGGEAAGYVLRFADGRAAYFAGDTNVFSDMQLIEQLYHPALAFLPIGDLFTMSPVEAALACRLLKAHQVVPMHFGTFPPLTGRPERLRELLAWSETEVWELEPGRAVEW
jgi:L-ascorbate metabolism protein UlaG (beta-lactamase superfamily)